MVKYIFKSERLGFRNWSTNDLAELSAINADPTVMEHYPRLLTQQETSEFIQRMQKHYIKHGYTYFAVEIIDTGEFIGFIGLAFQEYETLFTPATDIGWRLKTSAWGNGYATEGAKRCLEYAFTDLKLKSIISTCTLVNTKSQSVMNKLGMTKMGLFFHPRLNDYPDYEKCIWYKLSKP